jgi:hypothetical protein
MSALLWHQRLCWAVGDDRHIHVSADAEGFTLCGRRAGNWSTLNDLAAYPMCGDCRDAATELGLE